MSFWEKERERVKKVKRQKDRERDKERKNERERERGREKKKERKKNYECKIMQVTEVQTERYNYLHSSFQNHFCKTNVHTGNGTCAPEPPSSEPPTAV